MSTQALKIVTSLLIATGLLMLVGWQLVIGPPPAKGSSKATYRGYFRKGLVVATVLTVVVSGAGVGAFVLMRRARDEYRAEMMENMRELLETSRKGNESANPDA